MSTEIQETKSTWNSDKYLTGKKTYKVKLLLDVCDTCGNNGISDICKDHGTSGDSIEITIKELSWSKRNQIMSMALNWDTDGNTGFHADVYTKECLKEVIVEAPWGQTSDVFLIQVGDQLGSALDSLVPKPFSNAGRNSGKPTLDQAKKG